MKLLRYLALAILFILISCKSQPVKIERAFYYWKSSKYSLENEDLKYLKDNDIQKLYVKFFEVDGDSIMGLFPTAKTDLHIWNYDTPYGDEKQFREVMAQLEIIPTVFIKNKIFLITSTGSLDTLADNVLFLINKYYKDRIKNSSAGFREIQIDCDWTEKTKENYFYLLSKMKQLSNLNISCTLRLYPYKYREKMGIPPVDKVVLMCYNLVNPFANDDKNSILSPDELQKYLNKTAPYPLHMDIALPVFSWMQVYQNNQFAGIINPPKAEINRIFKPLKPLWYQVTSDMEFENMYLRVGDKIKTEEVTAGDIKKAISLLRENLSFDTCQTIILFHLDPQNLKQYSHETLNSFYTDFSN